VFPSFQEEATAMQRCRGTRRRKNARIETTSAAAWLAVVGVDGHTRTRVGYESGYIQRFERWLWIVIVVEGDGNGVDHDNSIRFQATPSFHLKVTSNSSPHKHQTPKTSQALIRPHSGFARYVCAIAVPLRSSG